MIQAGAVDIEGPSDSVAWRHRWGELLLFFSVAGIVLLSRVPFLNLGYGTQPDAWRVALTAREIAMTGEYSASRLPGYPIQEVVSSLIWQGGPWALNGMTALFSSIGAAFFALSMKALGSKDYIVGSLALAFIPIVYINSTTSLDGLWTLAFILGGLHFALVGRPVLAGTFLGLAIGCRITSVAMTFPLGLLLAHGKSTRETLRQIFGFCLVAGIIGASAFTPVVAKYGWSFFTFYEPQGYPPLMDVATQATLGVWGSVGLLGWLVVVCSFILKPTKLGRENFIPLSRAGLQFIAWILAIALYTIAYLRLPHQARYLIPVIPFVILVLERILYRRVFNLICIVFILSSFLSIGRSGLSAGPILSEHINRQKDLEFIRWVVSHGNGLQDKSVVVAGWWLPKIEVTSLTQPPGLAKYVYLLNESKVQKHLHQGFTIYYLPGMREFNSKVYGIDLEKFGAKPLNGEAH